MNLSINSKPVFTRDATRFPELPVDVCWSLSLMGNFGHLCWWYTVATQAILSARTRPISKEGA